MKIIYPAEDFCELAVKHREAYFRTSEILKSSETSISELTGKWPRAFKLNGDLIIESAVSKGGVRLVKSPIRLN